MPQAITRFTILISSPSDTKSECNAAEGEIVAINRTHGDSTGIELFPIDWRRDSRADSGDEPQALLNKQIVNDADIILAILKERMGTPTKNYGSGTEEEIMLAIAAGKKVLVYFWEPPSGYQPMDDEQFSSLKEFRDRIIKLNKIMFATFTDETNLRDKVRHDFTKLLFELEGSSAFTKPGLSLVAINNNNAIVTDSIPIIPKSGSSRFNPIALDNQIVSCYEEVTRFQLNPPRAQGTGCCSRSPFRAINYYKPRQFQDSDERIKRRSNAAHCVLCAHRHV